MLNYNKDHVTAKMAENRPGLTKTKALEQLDDVMVAIIDVMTDAKKAPENKKGFRAKLTMVGFGTFILRAIPKRTHRNPQTGTDVEKGAHNVIKFIEGKAFSDSINNK